MKSIDKIVIIGAGNVGTRLACAFNDAGCKIVQVAGRRDEAVRNLADLVNAEYTLSFDRLLKGQDLYLLALPDSAMDEILPQLGLKKELLVHTSGSVPLDILMPYSENTGVLYPLQTFTRSRKIKLEEVPFFIEANRIDNEDTLMGLAGKLSKRVNVADSVKRQKMHIAAIFASNFTNHMYDISRQLMEDNGFDFQLLVPLIRETAAKAVETGPENSQTGPAKRRDLEVIARHLDLLKNNPETQDLYHRISKNIIDQSKGE